MTFLDPVSKSGVFLREITTRLITGLEPRIPDLQQRVDHILTRQVFGIAITHLTSLLARRSLYCSKWANGEHSVARSFDGPDGNIWFQRVEHGEGIRRMFQEMRAAGLSDPLYHQSAGSVQLTLTGEPTERRLTGALPSVQQRILIVLRDAESLSTGEIAEAIGAARPTVLRHLGQLRDAGYVEWVGKSAKDPRASWKLRR